MNEDIERLNKLAKTLKDTGLAPTMEKALEMAKDMMKEENESISELQAKQGAQTIEKEGFVEEVEDVVEEVKDKVEDMIDDIKEKIHKGKEKSNKEVEEE